MKVFIITEGSKNTGFGHITRCLSLYQAFKERGILPDNSEILLLSFTGSRAFGWGAECYDIDIRLVAYIPGDYWDTFHDGLKWDVNGETFEHFKRW